VRDNRERLLDVLEAIANIERYSVKGKEAFQSDELIQNWFYRQFEIIGEAIRTLPPEIRDLAPDIPWMKIIGMRNILAHGYFDIDAEVVWDAVLNDVPELKAKVEYLLKVLE